jgi:peroxiredoxin
LPATNNATTAAVNLQQPKASKSASNEQQGEPVCKRNHQCLLSGPPAAPDEIRNIRRRTTKFAAGISFGFHYKYVVYYGCVILSRPLLLLTLLLTTTACYHGAKPSGIDKPASDFTIQDSDRTVSLNQFRGKIVVLNFWASWCPPCVDELPSLMQMQTELQSKGVVVLGVSVDDSADDYQKFLKDHNVNFLTVRDPAQQQTHLGVVAPVASKYGTYRFPETYIIDRNGIVRRKIIGPVNWSQQEIMEYLTRL